MAITAGQTSYPISFPKQKVSYKEKIANKKEWFKNCVEAAERLALYNSSEQHRKMNVLYDLDNDILDEAEMERVFNPMGLENASFPASVKNFAISTPKLDLLQGEELKRRFDWSIRAMNQDVESAEANDTSDMLFQMLVEELQSSSFDEEQFKKRFDKFAKYAKYDYKSKDELTATRILQYLWREQVLQEKFNTGFRHAEVGGAEIYRIDEEGNEPIVAVCDPRTIYPLRYGSSHRIEDADIVVQITYEPLNRVMDAFYDYLTPDEVDRLERLNSTNLQSGKGALGYKNELPPIYSNLNFGDGQGFIDLTQFNNSGLFPGMPYDKEGNIRVIRSRWIGRKRIGVLTYFHEVTGEELEKVVSEFYVPNEDAGESMSYLWINEAYEGTKLATDIFVKMQRRDVQMRHMDNYSRCSLGYVGTMYGRSLMERMEPYQYLYNVYMRRLELIMAKYKGPIYELDISKIPDEWEMDKWMYYADILGWAVVDSFNEAKKGSAMGKIAGQFNNGGRVLDPNIGNYIQQTVMMLQHIEAVMGKISGVNDQRLGQIDNRETVGGVERAVTQSSHITERLFFVHDETKKRVMATLLDTAKHAYKNSKSKKLNFVLDDMSRVFIEFNGEDFASTEYDLFITNSSRDLEIRDGMKQMAFAAAQNGGRMSNYAHVIMTDSISDMLRKIEASEDEQMQQQQQAQESQMKIQQQMSEAEMQEKQVDRDLEMLKLEAAKDKAIMDNETKRYIAELNAMNVSEPQAEPYNDDDGAKLDLEKRKHQDKMGLENKKLSETVRSNLAKESIQRNKPRPVTKK